MQLLSNCCTCNHAAGAARSPRNFSRPHLPYWEGCGLSPRVCCAKPPHIFRVAKPARPMAASFQAPPGDLPVQQWQVLVCRSL